LANEKQKGAPSFLAYACTFAAPRPFAQPEIDCKREPFVEAISLSFSSIFSQTLGTAKKYVGLAHCRVKTKVPYKASGLAK
jgi:hypothetical protein